MKHGRQILKYIKIFAAISGTILALVVVYNIYIRISISREESGRLRDSAVRHTLDEMKNAGSPDLPAILLLHGFGGSPNDLRPLIKCIPEDFTFYCPLLPGHGTESPRKLAQTTSADYEQAVIAHAAGLLQNHDELVICGFSYGAILALCVARELPVRAAILINPYTSVPGTAYYPKLSGRLQRAGSLAVPFVKKLYSGRINMPEGRAFYEPSYWHLSLKAYHNMHSHAASVLADLPDCSNVDIYFHFSANDVVSDPSEMRALATAMKVPDENSHSWSRSNHVLLFDYDAEQVVASVLQVLAELR